MLHGHVTWFLARYLLSGQSTFQFSIQRFPPRPNPLGVKSL
nr:MAG TPA: hypothetical protein [Caudoviricetes sp.]